MKCEETAGVTVTEESKVIQPIVVIPLPSPDCKTDWNYNQHGSDCKCNCDKGLE